MSDRLQRIDRCQRVTRFGSAGRAFVLATAALLAGCGSEDFPGAPGGAGDLNVPYVTTYNFGFQVRFDPIFGVNGNLQIISSADLLNLVSAANITRFPGTGVISGRALTTTQGISAQDVVLAATDVNGRRLGEFFYNSLGGTPDFVQTRGTTAAGGFTAFNVAPGEVFIKATAGGRGGARLLAFPDEVSLGVVLVNPVVVPFIGVVGEITEQTGASFTGAAIGVEVVGQRLSEAASCADEIPTQDQVDALQAATRTAFRFCVASDGDYLARLTGDERFFVPTYQAFSADSSRLAALQTAELTEFFSIQTLQGLEAAARAAGTTWDRSKGVLTALVRYGAGAPRSSAVVQITDDQGNPLAAALGSGSAGLGVIVYLDEAGRPLVGETSTGPSGRFIALNLPIPAGKTSETVYVTVTAQRQTAGVPERYVATLITPVFAGAVMFRNVDARALLPPVQGEDSCDPFFTGPVSGRVMSEDGLAPVADARITPLGLPLSTSSPPPTPAQRICIASFSPPNEREFRAGADGRYEVPINPNPAAKTPLLQSSTYLVKVEGATGSTEYLPTFQRLTTGSAERESGTDRVRPQIQNLVAVKSAALQQFQSTSLDLDGVVRDPNLGILLGTAVDAATNRPAAGISLRLTALDGVDTQSGSIYYFDFGGVPRRGLNATTPDGRFIVFNAPIGSVSLDVTSPDDTGNAVADSRTGGVTIVRLEVNNAPPESVDVSGRFAPLVGQLPSTTISLTAAGGDPVGIMKRCPQGTFEREGLCYSDPVSRSGLVAKENVPCTDVQTYGPYRQELDGYCQLSFTSAFPSAPFTVPLGSSREIVLKTSGSGLMDTYTFGLQTGERATSGVSVGAVSTVALSGVAAASGRNQGQGNGVIWGRTTAASLGEVDQNGDLLPLTCAAPAWTKLPDNSVVGCGELGTPGALVTGSFNDDTFRDLAIIDTATPALRIWLNTGSNSFVLSQTIVNDVDNCRVGDGPDINGVGCGVEDGPVAVLVVDYTGDGLSDLVLLNQGARSLSLLEGRGRGKFIFGGSLSLDALGEEPSAMAAADFNRDRIPDLMITDRLTGTIGALLGTGAGFRSPAPGVRVGNDPRAIVSGHLDFDGIPDLVFVTRDALWVMQQVGVTNRMTTYSPPGGAAPDLIAAAIGDVDRDGLNDVVVADRSAGEPKIWIFLNGLTGLQPPTSIPAGPQAIAVSVIDVNGDRSLDLIVVQHDGTVMYREGDGIGGFGPQFLFHAGGEPVALVMDDVTGDGALDAVLSDPGPGPGPARIVILPQSTRAVAGIAVAAVQAEGRAVGDVVYLDEQGQPLSGATLTGSSGKFAIFNVPPGPVWLRLLNGGLGSRFLQAYPDAVTNTTFPVIRGQSTTTTISGFTADAVLRPVGEVQIRFLGTQRATSSNPIVRDAQGNPTGGADYLAIVEANSDYVVRLNK